MDIHSSLKNFLKNFSKNKCPNTLICPNPVPILTAIYDGMKFQNRIIGTINVVSFKDFQDAIPVQAHEPGQHGVIIERLAAPGRSYMGLHDGIDTDAPLELTRTLNILMPGPLDQVLKLSLMKQAKVTHLQKENLEAQLYNACVAHMEQFGLPTHAVRLSRRVWLIGNPQDFFIVKNDVGAFLACRHPNRTLVYFVSRK